MHLALHRPSFEEEAAVPLTPHLGAVKYCMAELSLYSHQTTGIYMQGMRKPTEKLGTFGVLAAIRTGHCPDASEKRYFLSQITRSFDCSHFIFHDYYHFECQVLCLDVYSSALKLFCLFIDIFFITIPFAIR
jgi:hypothetical protein